jgi:hypothetical protein
MEFVLTTRANSSASQYVASSQPSSPRAISHGFLLCSHCRRFHLGPSQRKLFPRFPVRPPWPVDICRRFHLAPSQAISGVSLPSTLSSLPSHFCPAELFPSYSPGFPIRPRCPRVRLAPSRRSSSQAICYGFPSVHHVLAPSHANFSPSYISTDAPPSTLSSLPPCSLPTELSPSYFPRFPVRPSCRRFPIAPPTAK